MNAVMSTSQRLYTAEDLQNLPGGERYELIRGELCPMPEQECGTW